ncbi:MAG TPA: ATP-binding protein [Candidatus Acidoferrales bacterium]|nr:ATP-binding protein [Candidatus Acidoferrales bacterium]
MFELELDACNARAGRTARSELIAYLQRESTGTPPPDGVVETIFTELVANVCKHGGHWARTSVTWRADGKPVLVVRDHGPGFDISLWQPPADLAEGGRGLLIASALADDFSIRSEKTGTGCCIEAVLPARRVPPGDAA